MRYVSVDLETTGLNADEDQILEFAAVIEDTSTYLPVELLPYMQCYVKHDRICGNPYALALNVEALKIIANKNTIESVVTPENLVPLFAEFLESNGFKIESGRSGMKLRFTGAGKNFASFDKLFLQMLPRWNSVFEIRHRAVDPVMLYWKQGKDDELPSTEKCCERAGVPTAGLHTALFDARTVIELVRARKSD